LRLRRPSRLAQGVIPGIIVVNSHA
jgi:hypothetical protein